MRSLSRSALWIVVEAAGGAIFSSIGLLVIAGLIGPRDFGLSAIALGIMQTVNFFPDALFHDAIIQRRRLTSRHLGGAFWSVAILSVLLGAAVAALAPLAGRLYRQPELSSLLLALSASCLPTGIASIQGARLRRAMRFRALAVYATIGRALAAGVGVTLAVVGYGAWAVIAQSALAPAILAIELLMTTRWRFIRHFSFSGAREIGVFALTRTGGHFLDATRGRLFFAVLGQFLPLQTLGELSFAFRLVESITIIATTTIARLYLPVFSRVQANIRAVAEALRTASRVTAALLLPLFAVLAVVGDSLIRIVAGAKWQGMGALIPWLSVAGMTAIITIPAATALLSVGRPSLVSLGAGARFVALFAGVLAVAPVSGTQAVGCWTLAMLIGVPIDFTLASRVLQLSVRTQFRTLVPALLMSAGVGAVAILAEWFCRELLPLKMIVVIVTAGTAYLLFVAAFIMSLRQVRHI